MRLDWIIEKSYFVKIDQKILSEFSEFFDQQEAHQELKRGEALFRYMDDLDNKSAALLTHVSMLVAAVSIMLSVYDDLPTRILLLIEAGLYIFIASGLLRCIAIIHPGNIDVKKYPDDVMTEAIGRLLVYRRARVFAILTTAALLVGILTKVLLV